MKISIHQVKYYAKKILKKKKVQRIDHLFSNWQIKPLVEKTTDDVESKSLNKTVNRNE